MWTIQRPSSCPERPNCGDGAQPRLPLGRATREGGNPWLHGFVFMYVLYLWYSMLMYIYILYILIYIYTHYIYKYIYSCPDIFYFHAGISISSEGTGLILNERWGLTCQFFFVAEYLGWSMMKCGLTFFYKSWLPTNIGRAWWDNTTEMGTIKVVEVWSAKSETYEPCPIGHDWD